MRVLALTNQTDRPEAALLTGLAARGVEIEWHGAPNDSYLPELQSAGIVTHGLKFSSRISLKVIRRIRSRLRDGRFDLVHTFSGRALSNATIASWGLPPIPRVAYRGTVGNLGRFDPMSYLTWLSPSLSATVCVSNAVRDYLLSCGVPGDRLATIYKGHELSWYQEKGGRDRFPEFGVPKDAFVIICTANIRPVKGVDTLIDAFSAVHSECPRAHLLLVGDVRESTVREQAERSPATSRIHFAGFRKDVTVLAGGADVMVLASKEREGLPKSVIEGMAQGVPAVVTRAGGMPELVQHERSGLVVAPSNPTELGAALLRLYRDDELRVRLGHGARERIATVFTVSSMVDATFELYQRLTRRAH